MRILSTGPVGGTNRSGSSHASRVGRFTKREFSEDTGFGGLSRGVESIGRVVSFILEGAMTGELTAERSKERELVPPKFSFIANEFGAGDIDGHESINVVSNRRYLSDSKYLIC
jgi:hypothetical protein